MLGVDSITIAKVKETAKSKKISTMLLEMLKNMSSELW